MYVFGVGQALMTAAEVLISLHSIDAAKDGVPLRKVMACLDPCMTQDMRAAFPPEAMAVALQQLVTRSAQFLLCSKTLPMLPDTDQQHDRKALPAFAVTACAIPGL